MSRLPVPIIVTITGEGNSGGALGIAVGDRVLLMENSVYSVISPEGCASILWRDAAKAELAAEALKITARELVDMDLVDGVVPEPEGGAHTDTNRPRNFSTSNFSARSPNSAPSRCPNFSNAAISASAAWANFSLPPPSQSAFPLGTFPPSHPY